MRHFRKEEEALLPVLARHGGDLSHPALAEMLTQHARIRGLAMELGDEVNGGHVRPETLWNIGERLDERQAFTIIEETIPEEALTEVASPLATEEAGPHTEPWILTEGLSYDRWPGSGDSEGGGWG